MNLTGKLGEIGKNTQKFVKFDGICRESDELDGKTDRNRKTYAEIREI